jgi:prepilin-type N-terminal cleavage/methylation domain-containing protein
MQGSESGFTLIELLVAIVVVGLLTTVAILGINGLTANGSNAACVRSKDAAVAASAVYYSDTGGEYPQTFADLTHPATGAPLLETRPGMSETATQLKGADGWVLTLQPGATPSDRITFSGC